MSDFSDILESLKDIDWDKVKVIVNMVGGIIIAGKEIIDILKETGDMDKVRFIQIIDDKDAAIALSRARLVKSIQDRSSS